jgi:hypothetical protein
MLALCESVVLAQSIETGKQRSPATNYALRITHYEITS